MNARIVSATPTVLALNAETNSTFDPNIYGVCGGFTASVGHYLAMRQNCLINYDPTWGQAIFCEKN